MQDSPDSFLSELARSETEDRREARARINDAIVKLAADTEALADDPAAARALREDLRTVNMPVEDLLDQVKRLRRLHYLLSPSSDTEPAATEPLNNAQERQREALGELEEAKEALRIAEGSASLATLEVHAIHDRVEVAVRGRAHRKQQALDLRHELADAGLPYDLLPTIEARFRRRD